MYYFTNKTNKTTYTKSFKNTEELKDWVKTLDKSLKWTMSDVNKDKMKKNSISTIIEKINFKSDNIDIYNNNTRFSKKDLKSFFNNSLDRELQTVPIKHLLWARKEIIMEFLKYRDIFTKSTQESLKDLKNRYKDNKEILLVVDTERYCGAINYIIISIKKQDL